MGMDLKLTNRSFDLLKKKKVFDHVRNIIAVLHTKKNQETKLTILQAQFSLNAAADHFDLSLRYYLYMHG